MLLALAGISHACISRNAARIKMQKIQSLKRTGLSFVRMTNSGKKGHIFSEKSTQFITSILYVFQRGSYTT